MIPPTLVTDVLALSGLSQRSRSKAVQSERTKSHPDGEARPRERIEIGHQLDIHEHTHCRQYRHPGDAEGEARRALLVRPDYHQAWNWRLDVEI